MLDKWLIKPKSFKDLEWQLTREKKCNCGSGLPFSKCSTKSTYCG